MSATPWTPDQWATIVFYARIARKPEPLPTYGRGLTRRGASIYAARRLREWALQTEINAKNAQRSFDHDSH